MTSIAQKARVVDVLDAEYVVLDVGNEAGVKNGDRFFLYAQDREVKDINGKSLGYLELGKGYGKVYSVQEGMCILKSDVYSTSGKGFRAQRLDAAGLLSMSALGETKEEFLKVRRGDFARPV
jgi:hypothetical protein